MASIYKRKSKTSKQPFIVSFKDPLTLKWDKARFETQDKAEVFLQKHKTIEMCIKNNDPSWKLLYFKTEKAVTVGDVFTTFSENELPNKASELTITKYEQVMQSVTGKIDPVTGQLEDVIFAADTPLDTLRGLTREMGVGRKMGWEIYKTQRSMQNCTRRGINSYLRDLRTIFMWAKSNGGAHGRGLIDFEVITTNDSYNDSQLPEHKCKEWTNAEINNLLTNPQLPEYLQEIILVYVYTGARATELLRYNYLNRKKELHWHHVDFTENRITTLTKGKKSVKSERQHPRVMSILAKWKSQGLEAPLPFGYKKLRQYVATMNEILDMEFTAHDLRRLKSQMSEAELNNIAYAAAAIGDTSTGMVSKHYAPQSDATMDKINNAVSDRLNRIAEMN
tara:strand:- start:7285 stop:8463 length:1179 start_codon:yes stop_codon:yes gene_type:complete